MNCEKISFEGLIGSAADLITEADALVITSGAGMGIDSGLPDFRGENGFWSAYPALGNLGINFTQIANPKAFQRHPELAWGFYGHRLQLYRNTIPHEGFQCLLKLAEQMPLGLRHFTSNVDGQFQKAGFESRHVTQCHGSIHMLQCMDQCGNEAWPADEFQPIVDESNCILISPLPRCPVCDGLARPNILMFGDWGFEGHRYEQAESSLLTWFARASRPVVIEIGAGTAIPSARHFGEGLDCPLIRINPSESEVGLHRDISIPLGAKEALLLIADALI
ncbi:SIR2 family NAD-dependent protein deacylase [Undibacterium sp. Di24W]|uniref:SIR2 family NAD-dependent protein deacylase n=1 Tax=Undibacterium sp. Di24W TaxID=3413033 RepID=UPI003BF05804